MIILRKYEGVFMVDKILLIDLNEINPYVRRAGFQKFEHWPDKKRRIYDYEMFYCFSGKAHILINDTYYSLKKGTITIIPPNTPTKFWLDEKEPGNLGWIHFDFLYFNDDPTIDQYLTEKSELLYQPYLLENEFIRPRLMLNNGFAFPEKIQISSSDKVEELYLKIIHAFQSNEFLWRFICKIYLLEIFKYILEQSYADIPTESIQQKNISEDIIQYIKYNYYHKIKIDQIAHYIGLSNDYISKVFKQQTGVSIVAYLNQYRIEKAKQLLSQSHLSIKEIGEIVGFSDQYYFSKVMKQYTNYSPMGWRKHFCK